MASFGKDPRIDLLSREILPRQIQHILKTESSHNVEIDRVYHRALGMLIDWLLSCGEDLTSGRALTEYGLPIELQDILDREIGVLTPQEVGELYERLRGFRVDTKSADRPLVTRSSRSRRTQGLFYTPIAVVRHIVNQALDAIDTGNPEDYLDRRILDPAVGTGIFLGEVLEQIVQRVTVGGEKGGERLHRRIRDLKDRLTETCGWSFLAPPSDEETVVRIHLIGHCLYGVDLDPIAVRIAHSHLVRTGLRGVRSVPPLTVQVRVANSLIGAGPLSSQSGSQIIQMDLEHATAYFGRIGLDGKSVKHWKEKMGVFHWPIECPEVFGSGRAGFDAVVGNPPYEIVSVKESGIEERRREQSYFRLMYRTCQGKINTYRLMLERSITLLRPGGALGFIVPATLLADSTALRLRRMIFDETEILQTAIIPENARVFDGVTQALMILILRKGGRTCSINPLRWDGIGPVTETEGTRVPRELIEEPDFRVPLIRSEEEKALLEILARQTPFRGSGVIPAVGAIHQGEVNLTVHRRYITAEPTGRPLIRGEHVEAFRVAHPSVRPARLDWVLGDFTAQWARDKSTSRIPAGRSGRESESGRGRPWEKPRIALGRVVNMATKIRLKAAPVPPGSFLGDMTNYVSELSVPENYLLGLLNSRLLNWRFKCTSTNNYLSAGEIETLPIQRLPDSSTAGVDVKGLRRFLDELIARQPRTLMDALARLEFLPDQGSPERTFRSLALMVEWVSERIRVSMPNSGSADIDILKNVLDSLVVTLYSAVPYGAVLHDKE